jgi:hypothetical protein
VASKKIKRGRARRAAGEVTDQQLEAAIPKGDRRRLKELSDDERDRLKRLVKSRRSTGAHKQITLARPKTESVDVVVPSLEGKTDQSVTETTERVVDLLTQMYNRKDISQVQFAAGDRYRTSFEMLSASSGGAGDFDRVRAGGSGGGMAISMVAAAEDVRETKLKILYIRDYAVMHRVCVQGKTFDKVAQELSGGDLGIKFDRREIAYMFKSALSQMAAYWWPDKVPKIDQTVLDHVSEDGHAGDQPQLVEAGTPEWERLQRYRLNANMPPLLPLLINGNWGVMVRADVARLTAVRTEKPRATESTSVEEPAVVAHATRDKMFYSNRDEKKRK